MRISVVLSSRVRLAIGLAVCLCMFAGGCCRSCWKRPRKIEESRVPVVSEEGRFTKVNSDTPHGAS